MESIETDSGVENVLLQIDASGSLSTILAGMTSVETWVIDRDGKITPDMVATMLELGQLAGKRSFVKAAHTEELICLLASMSVTRMFALFGIVKLHCPDFMKMVMTVATDMQAAGGGNIYAKIVIERVSVLLAEDLAAKMFNIEHVKAMLG
ncbi:hypothetical protein R6242_21385 [Iodobacter sp. CM08]|uniref:type IVB secretion system protein IcmW n=1 Tax=Iodobacter sp. CM08 TaxID=3085902 RepID=UPI002981E95E|nr:hypothetical protein [Iodobacter sp. CM08]MDW5419130.1 hypothetical protein [Iodobacter sp. CM08]